MNFLFGPGDTDFARWVVIVRIDILLFLIASLAVLGHAIAGSSIDALRRSRFDVAAALALTVIAAALRFGAVASNLAELGGIGYSRILLGYRGHFGAAQLFSLVYARGARDLETAIALNRIAATLTVPLVYALCRRLAPELRAFPVVAAALLALHPLHMFFSATDGLVIASSFVAAASFLLLAITADGGGQPRWVRSVSAVGAATGLALLTQVRYENLLLVAPAAIYVLRLRHTAAGSRVARLFRPALALFLLLLAAYVVEAYLAGSSFQNPVSLRDLSGEAVREAFENPIFAVGPLLIGTVAAIVGPRSRIRLLAPLPFLAALPLMMLAGPPGPHFARTFANLLFLLTLVAAYGLALLWQSPWRVLRIFVAAAVVWAAALPVLFSTTLGERHLEIVEHDFFGDALANLPSGIDRIVVPDDEVLARVTHSTIELVNKYRMIDFAAGAHHIDLVGMTRFLEHPEEVDCRRDNCLFFRGAPCSGIQHYWFAAEGCAKIMTIAGPAVREEEVLAGSYLDCSIYRGEERQQRCEPFRKPQKLGLYRLAN